MATTYPSSLVLVYIEIGKLIEALGSPYSGKWRVVDTLGTMLEELLMNDKIIVEL